MNIDINTPTDDLLESWTAYSQRLISTMITSKTELDEFNKIKLTLKTKGIMHLEIHNVFGKEFVLRYTKQGGIFEKRIILS